LTNKDHVLYGNLSRNLMVYLSLCWEIS